jgi:hypothetical protein
MTFAAESNRVAVADLVLIASYDRSETGMSHASVISIAVQR